MTKTLRYKDCAPRFTPAPEYAEPVGAYTCAKAVKIKALLLDPTELGAKKLAYERLDQLTIDILFGVRS